MLVAMQITADFWVSQGGTISKPPAPKAGIFDSFTFDFFGQTNKQADLTSGADQALGVGLYVADQRAFAESFANVNVQVNKAKDATFAGTAKVCAIFAKDSANWRTAITKAFIPTNLIGDSADATKKAALENKRLAQIKGALALAGRSVQNAANVVKFGVLFPGATGVAGTVNQLVLPSAITTLFSATCFDPAAAAASGQGDLDYSSVAQRTEWCIVSETGTDPCAQPAQCG
ncbi:hypothetical protein PUNSTDRAFT_52340 [Punctularia strigosozonata HHB-11173 SS5]|uniref:uncharacterized protein n=1 Tax=Punctularia strigosozonata (strain HHB-11173) TaxID=741275 RepID=UPI00044181CB|nr:uncharacterized protein PUNSTDRAFT_52340 [Punctularia strigosozonata HHB-11173 SS5]EIN08872.1 hypothetical protein PUNSTDRAFT_52340 [Punctularia strigosozonata HHB-11173 SS5]